MPDLVKLFGSESYRKLSPEGQQELLNEAHKAMIDAGGSYANLDLDGQNEIIRDAQRKAFSDSQPTPEPGQPPGGSIPLPPPEQPSAWEAYRASPTGVTPAGDPASMGISLIERLARGEGHTAAGARGLTSVPPIVASGAVGAVGAARTEIASAPYEITSEGYDTTKLYEQLERMAAERGVEPTLDNIVAMAYEMRDQGVDADTFVDNLPGFLETRAKQQEIGDQMIPISEKFRASIPPTQPGAEDDFSMQLARGAGMMTGMVAPAALAGAAGAPGLLAMTPMSLAIGHEEASRDIEEETGRYAPKYTIPAMVIQAALEVGMGPEKRFMQLNRVAGKIRQLGRTKAVVWEAAKSMLEEGATEAAQQVIATEAKHWAKGEREIWFNLTDEEKDMAIQEGLIGGVLGLFGGVPSAKAAVGDYATEKIVESRVQELTADQKGADVVGRKRAPTPDEAVQARAGVAPKFLQEEGLEDELGRYARNEITEDEYYELAEREGVSREDAASALEEAETKALSELGIESYNEVGVAKEVEGSRDAGTPVGRAAQAIAQKLTEMAHDPDVAPAQAEMFQRQADTLRVTDPQTNLERSMHKVASERGYELVFYETDRKPGEVGTPIPGVSLEPGVIAVEREAGAPGLAKAVMLHEAGHQLEQLNPGAFRDLVQVLQKVDPQQWKDTMEAVQGDELRADLNQEQLVRETVSTMIERNSEHVWSAIMREAELEAQQTAPTKRYQKLWEWFKDLGTKFLRQILGAKEARTMAELREEWKLPYEIAKALSTTKGAPRAEIAPGAQPAAPAPQPTTQAGPTDAGAAEAVTGESEAIPEDAPEVAAATRATTATTETATEEAAAVEPERDTVEEEAVAGTPSRARETEPERREPAPSQEAEPTEAPGVAAAASDFEETTTTAEQAPEYSTTDTTRPGNAGPLWASRGKPKQRRTDKKTGAKVVSVEVVGGAGSGRRYEIYYPPRDFTKFGTVSHDAKALETQRKLYELVSDNVRLDQIQAGIGGNKLKGQPLLGLSTGCARNAAIYGAIDAGLMPRDMTDWMVSCHGLCYKNADQGAQGGGSPFSKALGVARDLHKRGEGIDNIEATVTIQKIAQHLGMSIQPSELIKVTRGSDKTYDSPALESLKQAYANADAKVKQEIWDNIVIPSRLFEAKWGPQEVRHTIVPSGEMVTERLRRVLRRKPGQKAKASSSTFLRNNQSGDWFHEIVSGAFDAAMPILVEEGFIGPDVGRLGRRLSVVTASWYVDLPFEQLQQIAEQWGELLIVQTTGPIDFSPEEAELRIKGFDKLRKAGLNPVMRLITDEFIQGGHDLNDPASVRATLEYIVQEGITTDEILETPLHIDTITARRMIPGNVMSNIAQLEQLFQVSGEEVESMARRAILYRQMYKSDKKALGLTYQRLYDMGAIDAQLEQALKGLGFSYAMTRDGADLEGVFPARCCTTGKCLTCGDQCMARVRGKVQVQVNDPDNNAMFATRPLDPTTAADALNPQKPRVRRGTAAEQLLPDTELPPPTTEFEAEILIQEADRMTREWAEGREFSSNQAQGVMMDAHQNSLIAGWISTAQAEANFRNLVNGIDPVLLDEDGMPLHLLHGKVDGGLAGGAFTTGRQYVGWYGPAVYQVIRGSGADVLQVTENYADEIRGPRPTVVPTIATARSVLDLDKPMGKVLAEKFRSTIDEALDSIGYVIKPERRDRLMGLIKAENTPGAFLEVIKDGAIRPADTRRSDDLRDAIAVERWGRADMVPYVGGVAMQQPFAYLGFTGFLHDNTDIAAGHDSVETRKEISADAAYTAQGLEPPDLGRTLVTFTGTSGQKSIFNTGLWQRSQQNLNWASRTVSGLYSAPQRALLENPQKNWKPLSLVSWLKKQPHVKQDELDFMGIEEWAAELNKQGQRVTKDEALQFMANRGIDLQEVYYGGQAGSAEELEAYEDEFLYTDKWDRANIATVQGDDEADNFYLTDPHYGEPLHDSGGNLYEFDTEEEAEEYAETLVEEERQGRLKDEYLEWLAGELELDHRGDVSGPRRSVDADWDPQDSTKWTEHVAEGPRTNDREYVFYLPPIKVEKNLVTREFAKENWSAERDLTAAPGKNMRTGELLYAWDVYDENGRVVGEQVATKNAEDAIEIVRQTSSMVARKDVQQAPDRPLVDDVPSHSSHSYDQPNMVGWTRTDTRPLEGGFQSLHLEELQSDMYQQTGDEEWATPGRIKEVEAEREKKAKLNAQAYTLTQEAGTAFQEVIEQEIDKTMEYMGVKPMGWMPPAETLKKPWSVETLNPETGAVHSTEFYIGEFILAIDNADPRMGPMGMQGNIKGLRSIAKIAANELKMSQLVDQVTAGRGADPDAEVTNVDDREIGRGILAGDILELYEDLIEDLKRENGVFSDEIVSSLNGDRLSRMARGISQISEANAFNRLSKDALKAMATLAYGRYLYDTSQIKKEQLDKIEQPLRDMIKAEQLYTEMRELNVPTLVPNFPFKGSGWWTLVFKRMLVQAVREGQDTITWSTAAQQMNLWPDAADLVSSLRIEKLDSGKYDLHGTQVANEYEELLHQGLTKDQLPQYVGEGVAEHLLEHGSITEGKLKDVELKSRSKREVGMIDFYDTKLVNYAKKLGKKYGARYGKARIEGSPPPTPRKRWPTQEETELQSGKQVQEAIESYDDFQRAKNLTEIWLAKRAVNPEKHTKPPEGIPQEVLDIVEGTTRPMSASLIFSTDTVREIFPNQTARDAKKFYYFEGGQTYRIHSWDRLRSLFRQGYMIGKFEGDIIKEAQPDLGEIHALTLSPKLKKALEGGPDAFPMFATRDGRATDDQAIDDDEVRVAITPGQAWNNAIGRAINRTIEKGGIRGGLGKGAKWIHRDFSQWLQDEFKPVKTLQNQLRQQLGIDLPDHLNVYLLQEQSFGTIPYQVQQAAAKYADPIFRLMRANNLTTQEVDEFLLALHAMERNRRGYLTNITRALAAQFDRIEKYGEDSLQGKVAIAEAGKIIKMREDGLVRGSGQTDRAAMEVLKKLVDAGTLSIDLNQFAQAYGYESLDAVLNASRQDQYDVMERWLTEPKKFNGGIAGTYGTLQRLFQSLTDAKLDYQLEYGLIDEESHQKIGDYFQFYAPLKGRRDYDRGDVEDVVGSLAFPEGMSQGMSVKGPENRRSAGRLSKPTNSIIGQGTSDLYRSISRGEIAKVGQAFLEMAEEYLPPELVEINRVVKKRVYDTRTGSVMEIPDFMADDRPEVFFAKRDGKTYTITIKDGHLAMALKGLGRDNLRAAFKFMSATNRFYAALATSLNPEFWFSNAQRDIQAAILNVQASDIPVEGTDLAKYFPLAIAAIAKTEVLKKDMPADGDTVFKRLGQRWEQMQKAGGRIGILGGYNPEKIIKRAERDTKRATRTGAARILNVGPGALAFIDDVNASIENAARLIAFDSAIEAGLSELKAASIARNLTVNFNRRGSQQELAAMYMFFNANVQGIARLFQALGSKRVRKYSGGLILQGFLSSMWNRATLGEDDDGKDKWDNIPEYHKRRKVMLAVPGDDNPLLAIQAPHGYSFFLNIGVGMERMMDAALRGKDKSAAMKWAVTNTFASIGDSFNPFGGRWDSAGAVLQNFMPQIGDFAVDIAANEDFAGRQIIPTKFDKSKPDAYNHYPSTSEWNVWAAQTLNKITGGDKIMPGWISVSPDTIEHLIKSVTGGLGSTTHDAIGVVADAFNGKLWGPDRELRKIPFVRRLTLEPWPGMGYSDEYYEIRDRFYSVNRDYEDGAAEDKKWIRNDYPEFLNKSMFRQLKLIEKKRKRAREAGDQETVARLQAAFLRAFRRYEAQRARGRRN